MVEGFTQEELVDIYRWAEHELRSASFKSNVDRAKRIQAKVSHALTQTPTRMDTAGPRPGVSGSGGSGPAPEERTAPSRGAPSDATVAPTSAHPAAHENRTAPLAP